MIGVGKLYDQKPVLKDISLSYFLGAKIGVIGPNGSGKSTLLRIMAGVEKDFNGEVAVSQGFSVGYLAQEPILDPEKTVRGIVDEGAAEVFALLAEFDKINDQFSEPMDDDEMEKLLERQGIVQEKLDATDAWNIDSRLELAMEALGCPDGDTSVKVLSGGEKRRVALCRLLLMKPDIILLDEPTNHLDAETVAWLEQHLQQYEGTVIAITHDRYFLDNVAGWILELDRGQGIPYKGNYSGWLEQKRERLRREEKQESMRQRTLQRELEWIRMSPKARHAKAKSRVTAYEKLVADERDRQESDVILRIPPAPHLGDLVVDFQGVTKGFDDRLLLDDVSFTVPPGAVVGVIGPNGAGKTTLFKMITGEESPASGTVRIGDTVIAGYADQEREELKTEVSVWECISGGHDIIKLGPVEMNSRAYVGQFNFSGTDQQKKVTNLSGGERNRVQLALMLKTSANLLLLDEPTNDLDVNTLRALEEAVDGFSGCAMVISHDRWFLDRISTHILAFEGDSKIFWFEGNFSEYDEDRRRRFGQAADQPHRLKYRKLTRE
jgi:energy-dependent translational throttle protein EttA